MAVSIQALTELVGELGQRLTLEERLQLLADRTAALLGAPRVSVRLLDAARKNLLAVARSGSAVHQNPNREFRLGEGLVGWVAYHGKALRVDDAELDERFVTRPDMGRIGAFLGAPLVIANQVIGVLSASNDDKLGCFGPADEQLIMLIAGMCSPHLEIARLQRLSQADPLTGALNRRGLDQLFPEVVSREGMTGPLCVAMVDLDNFKRINDNHGQTVGDEVLRRVALLLSSVLRGGDAVVRYGGEEFLIILPGCGLNAAARVAERARAAVESRALQVGDLSIRCTISIGLAERREGEPRDELARRADAALYMAKQAGRNRVVSAS